LILVNVIVVLTVLVTPVGNVVCDAVPVITDDPVADVETLCVFKFERVVVTELDCVFVGIDVGVIVFDCFILLEGNTERDTETLVVDVLDCPDDFVFVTDTELVFVLDVLPVILLVLIDDLEALLEILGILVVVSNDEYVVVAVGDIVNIGTAVFVIVTVFVNVF
jgi:hypothetical protein